MSALSVSQVADHLGVCPKTVRAEIERGNLRGFRVGRLWRVDSQALAEYRGRPVDTAPARPSRVVMTARSAPRPASTIPAEHVLPWRRRRLAAVSDTGGEP